MFSLFCLLFFFAAPNKHIIVGSHNFHGFKKLAVFHKQCIQEYEGIWFGQELWLPEKRLSDLTQLGVQFAARSGMEDSISSGIYNGRPHGGVSIAWSPSLDHVMKPLVNYRHKRVICVELSAEPNPILLASVYMPFYDSSKRQDCLAETNETIAMLEEILTDHPLHHIILGGDFNTEFNGNSPFDLLWRDFLGNHNLALCDQFVNNNNNNNNYNNNYTYIHDSLNHRKWNDHFFVSSSLLDSTDSHSILDRGDNPSDHLPILFRLSVKTSTAPAHIEPSDSAPSLKWERCTEDQILKYRKRLSDLLDSAPSCVTLCNTAHCQRQECLLSIQREYDNLIHLITTADKVLPRHKPGVQKHWWTSELTHLKDKSIDIHRIWQLEGKPRSGATNDERLRVRASYRHAIKMAQKMPKQNSWNKLHGHFAVKNQTDFWKSWKQLYNQNKSDLHSVVNGVTTREDIANSFKDHFVKVSKPNCQQRVDQLEDEFKTEYRNAIHSHLNCNCSSYHVSLENVLDSTFSLQKNKSADDSGIHAEHFFNAPLPLFDRLQNLFSKMLLHSHVPKQFQQGTIVPIVKDRHGNLGDMNNYRGITLAPIISKVFEYTLKSLFQPFLSTSSYQFGFKKKSSTSHAIHCLRETVDYYTSHGSNVYCSFLDASKAFDRLVHAGLFLKLLRRNIPLIFLDIIIMWYSDLQCRVR